MNRIDFDQVGGYRLETQTLSEMQKNYGLLQSLGEVLGKRAIVKGCFVNGTNVTDGVIYWDGELIEFKGGNLQTSVVIVQTVENILFLDGNQKPTFYRRHATFGTGVSAVEWSEFKRADSLITLTDKLKNAQTTIVSMQEKLDTIDEGAQVNIQSDFNQANSMLPDFIKNKPKDMFLMKGTFNVGNPSTDTQITISFPSVGTSNYLVVGSLVSFSSNFDADNDVFWMVKSKTTTSFKLLLREIANLSQNLRFDYALIPY